jgi:hypothetical protein
MHKYQVFISSTYEDLRKERDLIMKAVLEMGHIPVGMEMFSAADEEQWKLISRHIQETDYYVVVIAHRYGSTVDGLSYTEKEYDFAVTHGIPALGFLIADAAPWPGEYVETSAADELRKFKAKIRSKPVAFWTSAEDLYGKVAISLSKQFASSPRPGWVRATEAVDPKVINELSRLSEENRQLREELERSRIKQASETEITLKEEHLKILGLFAQADWKYADVGDLAKGLGWKHVLVQYYTDQLLNAKFLDVIYGSYGAQYYLAHRGRAFAVEEGLL